MSAFWERLEADFGRVLGSTPRPVSPTVEADFDAACDRLVTRCGEMAAECPAGFVGVERRQ